MDVRSTDWATDEEYQPWCNEHDASDHSSMLLAAKRGPGNAASEGDDDPYQDADTERVIVMLNEIKPEVGGNVDVERRDAQTGEKSARKRY